MGLKTAPCPRSVYLKAAVRLLLAGLVPGLCAAAAAGTVQEDFQDEAGTSYRKYTTDSSDSGTIYGHQSSSGGWVDHGSGQVQIIYGVYGSSTATDGVVEVHGTARTTARVEACHASNASRCRVSISDQAVMTGGPVNASHAPGGHAQDGLVEISGDATITVNTGSGYGVYGGDGAQASNNLLTINDRASVSGTVAGSNGSSRASGGQLKISGTPTLSGQFSGSRSTSAGSQATSGELIIDVQSGAVLNNPDTDFAGSRADSGTASSGSITIIDTAEGGVIMAAGSSGKTATSGQAEVRGGSVQSVYGSDATAGSSDSVASSGSVILSAEAIAGTVAGSHALENGQARSGTVLFAGKSADYLFGSSSENGDAASGTVVAVTGKAGELSGSHSQSAGAADGTLFIGGTASVSGRAYGSYAEDDGGLPQGRAAGGRLIVADNPDLSTAIIGAGHAADSSDNILYFGYRKAAHSDNTALQNLLDTAAAQGHGANADRPYLADSSIGSLDLTGTTALVFSYLKWNAPVTVGTLTADERSKVALDAGDLKFAPDESTLTLTPGSSRTALLTLSSGTLDAAYFDSATYGESRLYSFTFGDTDSGTGYLSIADDSIYFNVYSYNSMLPETPDPPPQSAETYELRIDLPSDDQGRVTYEVTDERSMAALLLQDSDFGIGNTAAAHQGTTLNLTGGGTLTLKDATRDDAGGHNGNFITASDRVSPGNAVLAGSSRLVLQGNGIIARVEGDGTLVIETSAQDSSQVKAQQLGSRQEALGALELKSGALSIEQSSNITVITITGDARLAAPELSAQQVQVADGADAVLSGTVLTTEQLDLAGTLQLKDESGKASLLETSTLAMQPSSFLAIDPSFVYAGSVTISGDNTEQLDGKVGVGYGSGFYLAASDQAAAAANDFHSADEFQSYVQNLMATQGYGAVGYLEHQLTLGAGGGLIIDPSMTSDAELIAAYDVDETNGTVIIKAGGALVLTEDAFVAPDEEGNYSTAAIVGASTVRLEEGSKVLFKGLDYFNGQTICVFDAPASYEGGVARYDTQNKLLVVVSDEDGTVTIGLSGTLKEPDGALAYTDDTIADPIIEEAELTTAQNPYRPDTFQARALELEPRVTGYALDSAVRFAALGGAVQNVQLPHLTLTDAVEERNGFYTRTASTLGMIRGLGLTVWVTPVYASLQQEDLKGGKSGALGFKNQLRGLTLGLDGSIGENAVLGVALQAGEGDSRLRGTDYARTKGSYDYQGLSLYALYRRAELSVLADASYTQAQTDITQDNQVAALSGKVHSKLLSAGVVAQQDYELGAFYTVTPHVGLRYHHLSAQGYDIHNAEGYRLRGKGFSADYVTVPVGVGISAMLGSADGWQAHPAADLSLIAVAGDKKVHTSVDSDGTQLSAFSDFTDDFLLRMRLGVDAEYGNLGLGLGYGFLGGSGTSSHSLNLNARYGF